jgi:hypothetical protein
MKSVVLPIANVSRLQAAGDALMNRPHGMPGIGLVWSPTGYGKSTATCWFCIARNGVYVRALRLWSAKTMLTTIARELDVAAKGTNAAILDAIVDALTITQRPLFIDEADYLMDKRALIDTLRDIHDLSTVPVVLIGEPSIEKEIKHNARFAGRISQWVKFEGLDMSDARMIARENCEVAVADDLLQRLYTAACPKDRNGNLTGGAEVRRLVVGLSEIEKLARKKGLTVMEDLDWPHGADFFKGSPVAIGNNLPVKKPARPAPAEAPVVLNSKVG